MDFAGPLWLGLLVDGDFCREMYKEERKVLEAKKRRSQLLITMIGEIGMPPTYFVVDKVCEKLGVSAASRDRVIEKLVTMGYQATRTHFNPQGIKSNASIQVVGEAVKAVL
jgi:tRNA (guanine26-N2/guanine27-N2)-dimethyltransferase